MQTKPSKKTLVRVVVLALLVFLAGLSTLAKNVQYLPKSNPARYLSIACKMKASSDGIPAPVEPQLAEPTWCPFIPEHVDFGYNSDPGKAPPVQRVSLLFCLRHRGPPAKFS